MRGGGDASTYFFCLGLNVVLSPDNLVTVTRLFSGLLRDCYITATWVNKRVYKRDMRLLRGCAQVVFMMFLQQAALQPRYHFRAISHGMFLAVLLRTIAMLGGAALLNRLTWLQFVLAALVGPAGSELERPT